MWSYFCSELIAFLCEHIRIFALNTWQILCFTPLCKLYKFLFFSRYELIKSPRNVKIKLNLAAKNCKISVRIIQENYSTYI